MVKRKIIDIDKSLCNGCGQCVPKCAEGALQIVDGKATIVEETYCDGLGACLGHCPQGAITIAEREAPEFDENEAREHLQVKAPPSGKAETDQMRAKPQWPIKINLVPAKAPFFENADLLVAADCAPITFKNFTESLLHGRRVVIGCPKSDDATIYAERLSQILRQNNVASVTVAHMEVPCCSGLKWAVSKALEASGKKIPVRECEITVRGELNEL